MAGEGRDDEHLGQLDRDGRRHPSEVQQGAEGGDVGRLLVDRDLPAAHLDRVDQPGRPFVREAHASEEFVARREVAHRCRLGEAGGQLTETLQGNPRDAAQRGHDVGLGLVRLVHHGPSFHPAVWWRHTRQPQASTGASDPPPDAARNAARNSARRCFMAQAMLTINSRNYGAWSLRGWLLCKMSGLDFEEHVLDQRRSRHPGGTAVALVVVPRAAAGARRRDRVGHDGDRRVPQRSAARSRAPAVGPGGARALSCGVR